LSNVGVADVVQTLAIALAGSAVSEIHAPLDLRPIDVVVRFAPRFRRDPASLARIRIPTGTGGSVPLGAVARFSVVQQSQPLQRDDYRDATYVGAELAGRSSTYAVIE